MFTVRNSGFPHEASFDQNIGIQTIALGLQCFRPGTNAHVHFFWREGCVRIEARIAHHHSWICRKLRRASSAAGHDRCDRDVAPWIDSSCFKLFQLL